MKKTKKLLALLCSLTLMLSLLPTAVMAWSEMCTANESSEETEDFYQELTELINSQNEAGRHAQAAADDPFRSARLIAFAENELDPSLFDTLACLYDGSGMWVIQFWTPGEARAAQQRLAGMGISSQPDVCVTCEVQTEDEDAGQMAAQTAGHLSWGVADGHFDSFISKYGTIFTGSGTVAIVDSGVDASHPFMSGKVLQGYDFIDGDTNAYDEYFHGTLVASVVVDCTANAPVKILPVRIFDRNGRGFSSTIATGIKYSADHGADVINLSLGGEHDEASDRAIQYAINRGAVVTIAAGNESDNTANYCPSHMTNPGAVVVASGNSNHQKAKHSNYGSSVDLMAPGVGVKGAVPGNKYRTEGGTSLAAPHAAAAAILLDLAWGKALSPAELEQKLYSATTSGTRVNNYYGYGFLDMAKASVPVSTPMPVPVPDHPPIPVAQGTYHIEAYCGKVVEIADSKTGDKANAQIWALSARNLGCQRFDIKPSGNGYAIVAAHSGKALDIADGSSKSGTNIWQWHLNQTPAQTWTFEDAGDGYVYIRSGLGTYMEVSGNKSANGTNLIACQLSGGSNQKFKLVPYGQQRIGEAIAVESGTYHVEAYCGKIVEVADSKTGDRANVQLWALSSRNLGCQKWQIAASGNGYVLKAVHSGKAMDVADGSAKSGTNVWQWHLNQTPAQTWTFEDAGGGYVYIKSGLGTYLTVKGGGTANGTNVVSCAFDGSNAQRFKLTKIG